MNRLERGSTLCDQACFDRIRNQVRGRFRIIDGVYCISASLSFDLPSDLTIARYLDHFFILSEPGRAGSALAPEQLLFDLIAFEYNSDVDTANNIGTAEILLRMVASKRVLDFGCGTGLALQAPFASTCELIGVDSSEQMLELAREAGMRALSLSELDSLPDRSFDGLISCYALHLHGPRLSLARSVRLLAQGGRIAANFHKGTGYAEVSDVLGGLGFEVVEPLKTINEVVSPVAMWVLP